MSFNTSLLLLVPSGSIVFYGSRTIPNGWLECNGQSISNITYPSLFEAIRYTYGGSNTSFMVPNLQNMFVRNTNFVNDLGKRQDDAIKVHKHETSFPEKSIDNPGKFVSGGPTLGFRGERDDDGGGLLNRPNYSQITLEQNINSLDPSIFDKNESRPQNIAFTFIIKL